MYNQRTFDDGASAHTLDALLAHGVRGDEHACAALYRRFSPVVMRLALGLLDDLQDAEEVVQDTFVYAFRNLRRYDGNKSAFQTWLFTIALSRCRNKRRRKRLAAVPLERLPAEVSSSDRRAVEALLERRGVQREVWYALHDLTPRLREAVVLRFLVGLRYREVGQTLGCSPKTAESRVRLGLRALRQTLTARGVDREVALAAIGGS